MTTPAPEPMSWPWFQVRYELPVVLDVVQAELVATITATSYRSGEVVMLAHFDGCTELAFFVRSRTEGDAVAAGDRTLTAVLPELAARLVAVRELGP